MTQHVTHIRCYVDRPPLGPCETVFVLTRGKKSRRYSAGTLSSRRILDWMYAHDLRAYHDAIGWSVKLERF